MINYIAGKKYILDAKYNNGGEVILVSAGRLFCRVKDLDTGIEWDTMLNRLSELEQKNDE